MSECGGNEICDEWLCMARKDKYSVTWRNKLLNWENRPQDDDILWEAFPQCYESGYAVSVVSIEIIFALRLVDIRYNTSIMHTVQTLLCFVVVCCWSIVHISWWRHQMETSSASLAFCAGKFTAQRPVTRTFDIFLFCAWTNSWANNGDASDLRRHRAHYTDHCNDPLWVLHVHLGTDMIVMGLLDWATLKNMSKFYAKTNNNITTAKQTTT